MSAPADVGRARLSRRTTLAALAAASLLVAGAPLAGQAPGWYTQGDFRPAVRFAIALTNDLPVGRVNVPVAVRREQVPLADLHEMEVTVVDPAGTPDPDPSAERLKIAGGHERRQEANGHALMHQLDDLDKDGVWDELFFATDLPPSSTKTVYVYLGMNQRGWNPHETHAAIGSYARHLVPFWESKFIGWKLWFPTSVDVYGKRAPGLIAHRLYMENLDGYGIGIIDPALGSDIQSVESSLGGGGICLFEQPDAPEVASVPRLTPVRAAAASSGAFNAGQISDTRYAFDVVVNGPVRSMVRVKTMNWNTGRGSYALEQLYTAYAHQSYSTCRVTYAKFLPREAGVIPGAGIRKKPQEARFYQKDGVIISGGAESIRDPETGEVTFAVPFIGSAIVVKNEYQPRYQFVPAMGQNHTFRVVPRADGSFEYLIAGAWSDGPVLKTYEAFEAYVLQTAREWNSPPRVRATAIERADAR